MRTRVRRHNSLRKERSFQRALQAEHATASSTPTSPRSTPEFHELALDVQEALELDCERGGEDPIFERAFGELVGDYVAATRVLDPQLARDVCSAFGRIDPDDFRVTLEAERQRVESAIGAREEKRRREKREREAREEEEERRKRDQELEEIRLINQTRIREAEERRAEARRREEAAGERAKAMKAQRDLEARLEEERQRRVEAERIARLERERLARLEKEARLRAEEEAREAQVRAEQAARNDEYARQRLNDFIRSTLDAGRREGISQAFQAQEDHFRAQMEEAARAAEAQAREQWFYASRPAQDGDVPMRDPSFVYADVSMASIPDDEPPTPHPNPELLWFEHYETRWRELLDSNSTVAGQLRFGSFPWPVFRFVDSLDELDEGEIRTFFGLKYPGKLDKNWKTELRRWHPDKLARFSGTIHPECEKFVAEGFSRCCKVMNAFQEAVQT